MTVCLHVVIFTDTGVKRYLYMYVFIFIAYFTYWYQK